MVGQKRTRTLKEAFEGIIPDRFTKKSIINWFKNVGFNITLTKQNTEYYKQHILKYYDEKLKASDRQESVDRRNQRARQRYHDRKAAARLALAAEAERVRTFSRYTFTHEHAIKSIANHYNVSFSPIMSYYDIINHYNDQLISQDDFDRDVALLPKSIDVIKYNTELNAYVQRILRMLPQQGSES
jgi:alpha-galactosidase/6-phospho-beta-glucosidase family protein